YIVGLTGKYHQIDLENLQKGIYILRIISNDGEKVSIKFTKN
ncbi:MAG: T9SS C-terminal target domain-containing protein, partial [Sphingobacteriales bacterium]